MKVSIITVTVDDDSRLAPTMDSVAAQSYPDISHIVVDGNHENRAKDFFARYPSSIVYDHPRRGVYEAINFGIARAQGDIVGLVHGGDLLSPDIVGKIAHIFAENPSLHFIYGDVRYYHPASSRRGRVYSSCRFKPSHLACGMAPPHLSLYLRREVLERVGAYNESFRIAGDTDFWMRLFADKSLNSRYVPEIFAYMSVGGISTSLRGRLFLNNKEKLRAMRLNGFKPNPLKLLTKYYLVVRDSLFNKKERK